VNTDDAIMASFGCGSAGWHMMELTNYRHWPKSDARLLPLLRCSLPSARRWTLCAQTRWGRLYL